MCLTSRKKHNKNELYTLNVKTYRHRNVYFDN